MRIRSYEDVAFTQQRQQAQSLSEVYRGADMAEWWGGVQRTLLAKIDDYSKKEGKEGEVHELTTFKQTWDSNPIGGSISKNTLVTLASVANQCSAHTDLDCAYFFSNLRDRLNRVIATKSELPTVPSSTGKDAPGGGKPSMPTGNFGAEKEPPSPSGLNPDLDAKKKEKVDALKASAPAGMPKQAAPVT